MFFKAVVKPSNRFALGLFSAAVATSAFADRYWLGVTQDALFSERANWAASDGGSGDETAPSAADSTGSTLFQNFNNGKIVYDELAVLGGQVRVNTKSTSAFEWSATDPSYGIAASNNNLYVCNSSSYSPSSLTIKSGTYAFSKFEIANADGGTDGTLTIDGGYLYVKSDSNISYKTGATGAMIVNGGEVFVDANMLYVGNTGPGSLTMNGGKLRMKETDSYGVGLGHVKTARMSGP